MTQTENQVHETARPLSSWEQIEGPLDLVAGLADMLRDRSRDVSAAARNEMIDQVALHAREAKRVLDDVVLASQIAAGEVDFESETVDLRQLTETVIEGWSLARSARITVSGTVNALGDQRWVSHVIWDLLRDALDRDSRRIEVRIREAFTKALVEVVDDGQAPSVADVEALASAYSRTQAAEWSGSTLGRGVALARGLAKGMGGDVRCFRIDGLNTAELSLRKQSLPTGRRVPLPDTELEPQRRPSSEDIALLLENKGISMVYQPVVDMRSIEPKASTSIGYESLARFPHSTPPDWFRSAGSSGMGLDLELAAIRSGIDGFVTRDQEAFLALNLSNSTLLAPGLAETLDGIPPGRLVLELSDTARIRSYETTRRAVEALRERGIRLAVDDVGSGEIDMWHILRLDPEIIKLDRALVADNNTRRNNALIHGITTMANDLGIMVIAEAIETEAERQRLLDLGVEFGQGYLFGKPSPLQWKTRVLSDVED